MPFDRPHLSKRSQTHGDVARILLWCRSKGLPHVRRGTSMRSGRAGPWVPSGRVASSSLQSAPMPSLWMLAVGPRSN